MDKSTTLQHIAKWSIDDRIDLVQEVWEGIVEAGWQPHVTEEQKAELDRRMCEMEDHPDKVICRADFERYVRRDR